MATIRVVLNFRVKAGKEADLLGGWQNSQETLRQVGCNFHRSPPSRGARVREYRRRPPVFRLEPFRQSTIGSRIYAICGRCTSGYQPTLGKFYGIYK
jgi:hypothetical protein